MLESQASNKQFDMSSRRLLLRLELDIGVSA